MGIDYFRFDRILSRCGELAARPDVDVSVKRVHDERLVSEAAAFRAAHKAVKDADEKASSERGQALDALAKIDQPYRQARAVALQYVTDLAIPDTLKSLDTDTDRRDAIRDLQALLDDHDDAPGWAKDLTDGEFGRLAPDAIREIDEWIAANGDLETATNARAAAYGPAYERYLGFKDVVRQTYGSSSIHYRRIHVRRGGKLAVDDPLEDPAPTPES